MFSKEYDNFMMGVQHALNLPIRTKCAELTVLLDRANLLELHNFFPALIDNIFGAQGTVCWGLRTTTETQYEDFRQLHHFLSPCGPLFKLLYMLLKDPNIKYEFSLMYLPVKIKQLLEHSAGHPFYSEMVNINPQTKQVTSLLLNPFDYYFFHFAYHLINPWQQRAGSSVTSWNTVYYVLCCDYILHFLPTDPTTRILPEIYYNGKNPNKPISPPSGSQPSPRGITPTGLVSPISFNKTVDKNSLVNLDRHNPRNEIWRSKTVLIVLTDMWLHNDSVSQPITTSDMNNSFNESMPMKLHYNELPTGEYMRIVRVLIKQLHAFSDSAKCDDTYLSELKKIVFPMIQGKFYVFLRNLIHRWPLDGSFRLVLELWLTYIQPWRYPANNFIKKLGQKDVNPDIEDITVGPEKQQLNPTRDHLLFIAENLLCFVVIFEQLLPRFGRVDLVSPKMSLMLYRITKVFDQPNLPEFLREIEQCVENRQPSPTHKKYSGWQNTLPSMSPNDNWSTTMPASPASNNNSRANGLQTQSSNISFLNSPMAQVDKKWLAITRQKIFELEGPNFCYKPLFSKPPAQEVYELLLQIEESMRAAQELIKLKEQEEIEFYSGFWGSIKYFVQSPESNDEFTLNDRRKVPVYLEVALNNLRDMFGITEDIFDDKPEPALTSNGSGCGFEMVNDSNFLTPENVRSRLKTIKYDGDPDLSPIRSDECTFLVRALYQFAMKVNENTVKRAKITMLPDEINPSANKPECLDSYILKQALLMTEVGMDLRDRFIAGDKYMSYLKAMLTGAEKAITALQITSKSSFNLAQKLLQSNVSVSNMPEKLKQEYESLQGIIQRQINTFEAKPPEDPAERDGLNLDQLVDKIKSLEARQRNSDNNILHANPSSTRSSKIDINEKYPENLSRESLIDLSVINLPPVPEDIFSSFSTNKPIRTSSLSSLKSMRKIKLFLQKAESSDDEDSSDNDDHDYSRLVYGDSDDSKASSCHSTSTKKLHLGYIKEETQD